MDDAILTIHSDINYDQKVISSRNQLKKGDKRALNRYTAYRKIYLHTIYRIVRDNGDCGFDAGDLRSNIQKDTYIKRLCFSCGENSD